jgi:hypothetical protein
VPWPEIDGRGMLAARRDGRELIMDRPSLLPAVGFV